MNCDSSPRAPGLIIKVNVVMFSPAKVCGQPQMSHSSTGSRLVGTELCKLSSNAGFLCLTGHVRVWLMMAGAL